MDSGGHRHSFCNSQKRVESLVEEDARYAAEKLGLSATPT